MDSDDERRLAGLAAVNDLIRQWKNEFRVTEFRRLLIEHAKPLYIDVDLDCPIDKFDAMRIGKWGGWYLEMDTNYPKPRLCLVPINAPRSCDYSWSYVSETVLIRAALEWNPETEGSPAEYLLYFPNIERNPGELEEDCRMRRPLWLLGTL